ARSVDSGRPLALGRGDVRGWTGTVVVSHAENNWRAWHDSHEGGLYLYHGQWGTLGRTGGWFQRLTLSRGAVDAQTVDLVSIFPSVAQARSAYHVVVHQHLFAGETALPIGAAAVGFTAHAGVGSGPNLVLDFRTLDVYAWQRNIVVEVSAQDTERAGPGAQRPIPNAAAAVAAALIRITP
ncbi:MAG: hypothetical protein M3Z66_01010, partial [Chloroflexota bacterium]|nr:hypothetical protein [Chloroflexota bacterium]